MPFACMILVRISYLPQHAELVLLMLASLSLHIMVHNISYGALHTVL